MRPCDSFACVAAPLLAMALLPVESLAQHRTLSEQDRPGATLAAELVLDAYARRDSARLSEMLTPRGMTEAQVADFELVFKVVGALEHAMLADEIVEVAPGCHQRRYAAAHAWANAKVSFQLCGSGKRWSIAHFNVVPAMEAASEYGIAQELIKNKGVDIFEPVCVGANTTPIGSSFECWVTSRGRRESAKYTLDRTGPGTARIVKVEHLGATAEASRELLEPRTRRVLTRMALAKYDALLEDASLQMQGEVDRAHMSSLLAALQVERGPMRRIRWVGFTLDPDSRVAKVRAKMVHADGEHAVELFFRPDRGEWRLLGLNPLADADSRSRYVGMRANVEQLMRKVSGDANARIECPWQELAEGERTMSCTGIAHGRRIAMSTRPGDKDTSIHLTGADLQLSVGALIARLEHELGWSATKLECDEEEPRVGAVTLCRVTSPQGDRVLTVVKREKNRSITDLVIER